MLETRDTHLLLSAFEHDRLAPCWLIIGDRDCAKETAFTYANHILTSLKNNNPLPRTRIEHHIKNRSYGNFIHLTHDVDSTELTLDDLEPLTTFMTKRPLLPGWRVAIIDTLDHMNRFCLNKLLKTLEEPPAYTLILLIARTLSSILPTIRSRCQRIFVERASASSIPSEADICINTILGNNAALSPRIIEPFLNGDKNRYYILVDALFQRLYTDALHSPNKAEAWLVGSHFWRDAVKGHLDLGQAFITLLLAIENPYYLHLLSMR
jgi:hypothetical protein